ncbi:hypothetical protein L7F22_063671 [Adiantum nelumboides]|nr:hypothetical protein [Adiantum nelumboides]
MEDAGGWLECSSCSASLHWACLAPSRQRRILANINIEEQARCRALGKEEEYQQVEGFEATEMLTTIECDNCFHAWGWRCIICNSDRDANPQNQVGLLFRCKRCLRACHYECIQQVEGDDTLNEAAVARQTNEWKCLDCESWSDVEQIIAWRPCETPNVAPEPATVPGKLTPIYTASNDLPREYLVKFKHQSYRETQWVPHRWLKIVSASLLSRFLRYGSGVELEGGHSLSSQSALIGPPRKRINFVTDDMGEVEAGPPASAPDAQERIPSSWKTPERILDVFFRASSVEGLSDPAPRTKKQRVSHTHQQQIADELKSNTNPVHIDDVDEDLLSPDDAEERIDWVAKCLIKWQDVDYQKSTWENVPDGDDPDFLAAFCTFLQGRQVELPDFEPRSKRIKYQELYEQPAYVAGGELLDFQLEGLNWLRYGWMTDQPKILADEMGLGKTIQIISFIGSLHHEFNRGPVLIVVPNSTLPNWVRELEKWLPSLRVVPFWGGKDSRAVVEQYELFHAREQEGRQPLKAHVVITSDSTARLSLDVLDRVPTWEALIVDEGQSLKAGDGGLLYQKLASLDTVYRLIMTGTPLNNNIGELFHLLKFLKPGDEWDAIGKLRRKYEILTPELVDELQPKLIPFFLRRLKQQVANLPPKIEIFVPISLKPVQKRIYKSIIESNVKDIQALIASKGSKARRKKAVTSLNNILMQLRKCIQHPYLVAPDLGEFDVDDGVQEEQEHERLILASAKMTLLRQMLPKLKARGHRVLIFSQFVIHLELVEAFVQGEGYSYLRLDGQVGQRQRQRGIDAFNAPGSDIFLYLLSTRAGGVGINLAAADTVIMLDPDFNPHVDMQAISRAHRIGQTKRVLVFRLLAKMTAEQRIIEMARKKLVLDHLIVQNLDNVSSSRAEEMEDILRYGAKALFDQDGTEENERDIKYNDEEVEALINRAETEEVDGEDEETSDPLGALALPAVFEQPMVTEDDNAEQQTAAEERLDIGDADFWEELLANSAKQNEHSTSEMTLEGQTGRGKRVRRPVKYFQASMGPDRDDDITVTRKRKKKGRQQGGGSESEDASFDEAQLRRSESPDDLEGQVVNDRNALAEGKFKRIKYPRPPETPIEKMKSLRTEETDEAFAVLTRLPHPILRDVLDATGPVPEPTAPAERPQLTNAHCVFFHKALNYPMNLFPHAFMLVESRHLPAQVIDLPDEGARLLNKQVVASHLFNAARRALAAWKRVAGHYAQDLEAPSHHRQHLNELRVLLMTTDSGRQLSHQEAEQFCEHVRQMAVPDLDMLAAAARALLSLQIPKVSMADRLRAIAGTSTSPFARGNVKVSFTDFTVRNEVRKTATQIINANEKGVTRPDARSTDGTSAEASPGRYRVQIDENAYKRRKPGRPPGSGKGAKSTEQATKKRAEMSAQERALAAAGLLPDGNIRETLTPGPSTSAAAPTSASAVAVPRPRPTPVRQSAPDSRGPVAVITEPPPAQSRATGTTTASVRPADPSVANSNGQSSASTNTRPPSTSNSAAHKRDEKCFICEKSPYHYISKCPFLLDPPAARERFNHLLDTVVLDRSRTKEERQGMRRLLIFLKYALDKREEGEGLKEMVSQEEIV